MRAFTRPRNSTAATRHLLAGGDAQQQLLDTEHSKKAILARIGQLSTCLLFGNIPNESSASLSQHLVVHNDHTYYSFASGLHPCGK